MLDKNAKINQ